MSECQVDLLATTHARLAVAETTLQGMTTGVLSASDVTTVRDALIAQCVGVKRMMDAVISLCQTTLDTTSAPSVSNGSDAFTWTFQQLSSTDWSGPPKTSNSYTKWEIVGKPETSEGFGLKSLGSVTPPATSTSASTSTIPEALIKLNKAIMEAEHYRRKLGL